MITCKHLGEPTGELIPCRTCKGKTELKVYSCALHDKCTLGYPVNGMAGCGRCINREPANAFPETPKHVSPAGWPIRFDETTLHPDYPGRRFNGGLLAWRGRYLLAWRSAWSGSDVHLSRLDAEFRWDGSPPVKLDLRTGKSNFGREDARLYFHDGALHVAFSGVEGRGKITAVNQMYARLRDDLSVERIYHLEYPGRRVWEKNWQPFSHDGTLYAVYSIRPHRILRLDSGAERAYLTGWRCPWQGGELRGGTPPVLVGEEYWSFFHDHIEENGRTIYRTGLYAFDAKPPFHIRRITPQPILTPDMNTRPRDPRVFVVFTCGAVRTGEDFVLSSGANDRWLQLDRFSHAELESRLVPVAR